MTKIDPSLADNPLIFPTADYLKNAHGFMGLDGKTEQKYQQQFAAVIGG
jgi:spermidine/putrescine transport system substrate-binding protein